MKRTAVLRIALTEEEIISFDAVAADYRMTLPDFTRAMLTLAREERPEIVTKLNGRRRPGRPAKRHSMVGEPA